MNIIIINKYWMGYLWPLRSKFISKEETPRKPLLVIKLQLKESIFTVLKTIFFRQVTIILYHVLHLHLLIVPFKWQCGIVEKAGEIPQNTWSNPKNTCYNIHGLYECLNNVFVLQSPVVGVKLSFYPMDLLRWKALYLLHTMYTINYY